MRASRSTMDATWWSVGSARSAIRRPKPTTSMVMTDPTLARAFSPPDPPLSDGRTRLRLPVENDEQAVFEACQDPEIQRWVPIPVPYRREHAHEWIADAESGWSARGHGALAIADASDDRFLGAIGLGPLGEHRASIGYWVVPAERRRGIATDAVRLLGRWALLQSSVRRLELYHFVGNDVSGQVAEKVGFRREGVLRAYVVLRGEPRDCVMYSLLASEIETVGSP
jgi:RimJ/RimL family protein N-acetyltransferase